MISSGIEPETLKFVAQFFDQLCHSLPPKAALCQLILNGPDPDVTVRTNFPTVWLLWYIIFNVYGPVHLKNIPINTQEDATLHSLFYLETALHVSGGTSTHHQESIQLYLQHLVYVRPLLLSAAIAADSSNGLTNTRFCRYSCMRSWWWVEVPPEICRAVSRYNKLCNVASSWIYIGIHCFV
jgi:hypothetical protein